MRLSPISMNVCQVYIMSDHDLMNQEENRGFVNSVRRLLHFFCLGICIVACAVKAAIDFWTW
jgi:hypothetical protein